MILCNKCLVIKDFIEFYKSRKNVCKECVKKLSSENKKNNPGRSVEWARNNKDKVSIYNKKNRPYMKEYNKEYAKNHKEYFKSKKIEWYKSEYGKESKRKWCNNYNSKNPHTYAWRGLLRRTILQLSQEKYDSTINMLGYSSGDLKIHITSLFLEGMSWENYGEWHIDHIKPVSSFDKDTHPSIVNSLDNLQPLWATTRLVNNILHIGNLNLGKKHA